MLVQMGHFVRTNLSCSSPSMATARFSLARVIQAPAHTFYKLGGDQEPPLGLFCTPRKGELVPLGAPKPGGTKMTPDEKLRAPVTRNPHGQQA